MQPHADWLRHAWPLAVLAMVLVLHTVVNAWWLATDNLPRMGDDAQHAMFAHEMHAIATESEWSVQGRVRALAFVSTGIYPPLFHYASMLSGLVFGPTRAGFAAINTPILWLLTFAVYVLAAHCLRPRYALLAAATCSALPLIAGASRLCITDLLTALWVTLALIVLMHADGLTKRREAILFGFLIGLGLLTRWMAPIYLAVPALVAVWEGWRQVRASSLPPDRQREATRGWLVNLGLAAAVMVLIAAPWYAPRVPQMLGVYAEYFRPLDGPSPFHAGGTAAPTVESATVPTERPVYLHDFGPFEPRTWVSYALLLNNKALFLPMLLLALAGVLIAMLPPRRRGMGYLLAAVLGSYLLLTLFWTVRAPAPRYLIPLLPALAVFPALALQAIPADRWRKGCVALCCAWLAFQFLHFSVAPISGLARAALPIFQDHPLVRDMDDSGLVVWSSHVNASGARIGPPYTGLNWIDRAFETMAQHEVRVLPGNRHQANVMLAGALKPSLESVQHLHWPRANPLDPASLRVGALINPYAPIARWPVERGTLGATFDEPVWLDAIALEGTLDAISFEYDDGVHGWRPLTTVRTHDGYGFQSFERVRVLSLRAADALEGPAQITAFHAIPQPRPMVLIEHADHPRDWPVDRIEVADYLVVVSPKGGDFFDPALDDFFALDAIEANLHGYWDERRITVHARRHARPVALDTLAGMRVEVIEAGDTLAGRWDMPWWRVGRWNALGLADHPEAWEAGGPVTLEASFPDPIAFGRIEAATSGAEARWEYRLQGEWSPLEDGVLPPGAVDALRLTLSPSEDGAAVGLRQVYLERLEAHAP